MQLSKIFWHRIIRANALYIRAKFGFLSSINQLCTALAVLYVILGLDLPVVPIYNSEQNR